MTQRLRRDGGEVYGDISFQHSKGVVLTAENGKKYLLAVSNDGALSTSEYFEEEEEAPEVATLTPVMRAGATWYDADLAGAAQNTITSIAFNAAYEPTGNEDASWPCDEDLNGNIMAYRNGTEVVIKSTTGSEGVKLNADSSYMFANDGTNANFAVLAHINGTETLKADKNTTITRICQGNTALVDPICIPEGVTKVTYAFSGCTALKTPPVFPDGVESLSNTFNNCSALQYLPEIPESVVNLSYAFLSCTTATKAPSVIPAAVSNMSRAFRNCYRLNGAIEINAANVTDYERCFENACNTSGSIVLTGSCSQLSAIAATNAAGKVTVAS